MVNGLPEDGEERLEILQEVLKDYIKDQEKQGRTDSVEQYVLEVTRGMKASYEDYQALTVWAILFMDEEISEIKN